MEEKQRKACSAFRFLVFDGCQSVLITKKTPLPRQVPGYAPVLNNLSADCSRKESIYRFFGRTLYKNHENAKCSDFQFHNYKFSQERYFGPFCCYSL